MAFGLYGSGFRNYIKDHSLTITSSLVLVYRFVFRYSSIYLFRSVFFLRPD